MPWMEEKKGTKKATSLGHVSFTPTKKNMDEEVDSIFGGGIWQVAREDR